VFHLAARQRGRPIRHEGVVLLQAVAHCPSFYRTALTLARTPGTRPLPTRTCPIQLIWTDGDQMFPPERFRGALLDRVAPDAETTIPDCGHMLLCEKPDRVTARPVRSAAPPVCADGGHLVSLEFFVDTSR
jgi:pimeloyl-ACP methyl ester carboxylesterase